MWPSLSRFLTANIWLIQQQQPTPVIIQSQPPSCSIHWVNHKTLPSHSKWRSCYDQFHPFFDFSKLVLPNTNNVILFYVSNMKLYYLSPNNMENSNKWIFRCLFMVLTFLVILLLFSFCIWKSSVSAAQTSVPVIEVWLPRS